MNDATIARSSAPSEALPASTFTALVCGLGLYMGWQTVGISPTLFPQPNPESANVLEFANYLQTTLFLILLMVLGRYAKTHGSLLSHKLFIIAAATLTCASTAGTYAFGWMLDMPGGTIATTVLEASKAAFLLLWAECLCRVRFRDTLLCVSLSYVAVFLICLLVAGLREIPALITHSVLPLLSGAALMVLRRDRAFVKSPEPSESNTLPRLPMRLFAGVGLFGAVILLTNTLSESKSSATAELFTLLAGLAISIAIALLATRRNEKFNFTFLYRMLTPLIIASVMLVLTLESGNQQYEAFVIGVSWAFFRIFTWTLWCSIALRSHASAAYVFALGQFALTFCSTTAQFAVDNLLPIANISLPMMISAIITLAVGTSAFVMSESDIKQFFEKRKSSKKRIDEEELLSHCVRRATQAYGLSNRESEIASLVIRDKNNAVIEGQLCITESTLRTHLRNIYAKMSVHSRQELIEAMLSYARDDS